MRGLNAKKPANREAWAKLMRDCGVKVIHVAEHDLQVTDVPKHAERVRQHLVDPRLRRRRLPAGRTRLGHA